MFSPQQCFTSALTVGKETLKRRNRYTAGGEKMLQNSCILQGKKCLQRTCVCESSGCVRLQVCEASNAPTWALLGGAGNDPLHKTAFHQRLAREPGPLPFGALRLITRIWIFPIGHHATIHGFLILLNNTRNTTNVRLATGIIVLEPEFLSCSWSVLTFRCQMRF